MSDIEDVQETAVEEEDEVQEFVPPTPPAKAKPAVANGKPVAAKPAKSAKSNGTTDDVDEEMREYASADADLAAKPTKKKELDVEMTPAKPIKKEAKRDTKTSAEPEIAKTAALKKPAVVKSETKPVKSAPPTDLSEDNDNQPTEEPEAPKVKSEQERAAKKRKEAPMITNDDEVSAKPPAQKPKPNTAPKAKPAAKPAQADEDDSPAIDMDTTPTPKKIPKSSATASNAAASNAATAKKANAATTGTPAHKLIKLPPKPVLGPVQDPDDSIWVDWNGYVGKDKYYYATVFDFLECKLMKKDGNEKYRVNDERFGFNAANRLKTPFFAAVQSYGPPFGDWLHPSEKLKKHHGTTPVKCKFRFGLSMRSYDSHLRDADGFDPHCRHFVEQFVPKVVEKIVWGMIDNPSSLVESWLAMYKQEYEDTQPNCDERTYIFRQFLKHHVNSLIYIPENKETKTKMPELKRVSFMAPVAKIVYKDSGRPRTKEPNYTTDGLMKAIYAHKDEKGNQYEYNAIPWYDGKSNEIPFEKQKFKNGDVVNLTFTIEILNPAVGQDSKTYRIVFKICSGIKFRPATRKTEAELMREENRESIPGGQGYDEEPIEAPSAAADGTETAATDLATSGVTSVTADDDAGGLDDIEPMEDD